MRIVQMDTIDTDLCETDLAVRRGARAEDDHHSSGGEKKNLSHTSLAGVPLVVDLERTEGEYSPFSVDQYSALLRR